MYIFVVIFIQRIFNILLNASGCSCRKKCVGGGMCVVHGPKKIKVQYGLICCPFLITLQIFLTLIQINVFVKIRLKMYCFDEFCQMIVRSNYFVYRTPSD